MIDNLLSGLEKRGYAARVVAATRVRDLKESIEAGYRNGLLNEELYKEYLSGFAPDLPADMPDARSLIIVAVRQPQFQFTFMRDGKPFKVIVPPTYLHPGDAKRRVQDALTEILAPRGYRVMFARVPNKLLAVHSGLASYGLNNVTYVPGMGSFHRLAAFFSDMPCDADQWHEMKVLDRCESCQACYRLCPAGAIGRDRFLLHADRCIVFHNEKPCIAPFPSWMKPAWHNCLVGCMLCQKTCPENKGYLDSMDGGTFSHEETRLLLAGTPADRMPADLVRKLEASDLMGSVDVIPRNLNVLMVRQSPG